MADRPPTRTIGRSIASRRPRGYQPVPAVSLALEPANITAVANDIGTEVIFLRQLIAQARPDDVAVAHLHQRRIAQHHHGAGRGAQAQAADGRAARATMAARSCGAVWPISRRGARPTTFRAFRKCRRPSITSFAKPLEGSAHG